ncbi:MAG TPA: 4Fe-4S binding protein [Leptolyngbyaceae cyanobacterium M65_K2018_010]|nr:4Fe-4S binding protein [Leptolyngbyaceae cyanobacterium M65_K2018_010]
MSYTITHNCIGCQRCLSACPTGAIQTNGVAFWIEIDRCNQCQGSHGVPQCWATCPTNEGCVPLATRAAAVKLTSQSEVSEDYWESWFATYNRLVARLQSVQDSGYWQHWFDAYSQALRRSQMAS